MADYSIESLTQEQRDQIEPTIKKWIDIGMNHDPVDVDNALKAIKICYEDVGLTMPDTYFVFQSPMQAAVGVATMQDPMWPEIYPHVQSVGALKLALGETLPRDTVPPTGALPEVDQAIKTNAPKKTLLALKKKHEKLFQDWITKISGKTQDKFWTHIEQALSAQNPGAHDAGWLGFYDYIANVLGMKEETKVARGHIELAKYCGWWIAYQNCVILQDRHIRCCIDEQGRPHSTDGMALEYSDGFGLWAIDGFKVDKQIVMAPETQTLEDIDKERNMDVRAIRLNRYPWKRYLLESNAQLLDKRGNDAEGTKEALYQTQQGRRFFYTCNTGRLMGSSVPDNIETCIQAQNYLGNGRPRNVIART